MQNKVADIFEFHEYKDILIHEYQIRCSRRKSYSMRAFSRDLGLSQTALNDVLHGRYGLSTASAQKIAVNLGLNEQQSMYFICLVEKRHARSNAAKKAAELRLLQFKRHPQFESLPQDSFEIFSKWYHLAIVELVSIYKGKLTVEKCSAALGISSEEVRTAFVRLERCGLLQKRDGKWKRNLDYYSVESSTPSDTIRSFHRQMLNLALSSIDQQSIEERALVSTVLSLNTKILKEAIPYLNRAHDDFVGRFEDGRDADSVYGLSFQLFRIDGKEQ